MRATSGGGMNNISETRKGASGRTPRIRVAAMRGRPLPGSTRRRDRFRSALPHVAVGPFNASGCRKRCSQVQMQKAVLDRATVPERDLIVLERISQ